MKLLTHIQVILLGFFISLPLSSFALGDGSDKDGFISNPLKGNGNLFAFINSVIDAAIQLGAIVAVVAIVYAGFLFVTAQGDEKKIETAKKVLLYTVIGIAILLGARVIEGVVTGTITNINNASK